jgi:RNA polymerase sigma-32 factor
MNEIQDMLERKIRGLLGPKDHTQEADSTTLVPHDPLRRYLYEISKFSLLSREEEHELAAHYHETGDEDAEFRLITSNLRLVVTIAMIYKKGDLNIMDCIQEGNIGLLQALKRFDPLRGTRLTTYAAWWIRAYIIKFLFNNARLIKIGTTNARRKILMNLTREKGRLEVKGITPTTQLLAHNLGVKEAEILQVEQGMTGPEISLDAPIGGDGTGMHVKDSLRSIEVNVDDKVAQEEFRDLLESKFAEFAVTLSTRERLILKQRMIAEEPETLQQIAERYGISREAVRVAEKRLTGKLKKYMTVCFGNVLQVEFNHQR